MTVDEVARQLRVNAGKIKSIQSGELVTMNSG